ncbi:hypothetical protein HHI36_017922 [Cryptolaemus montrouzieri]|uniref:Uncharacterized protein n=1 Tax=Cryptolaemus montrouzieri TaxID=559131 RepID=A0ABD2NYF2_9CUCU
MGRYLIIEGDFESVIIFFRIVLKIVIFEHYVKSNVVLGRYGLALGLLELPTMFAMARMAWMVHVTPGINVEVPLVFHLEDALRIWVIVA